MDVIGRDLTSLRYCNMGNWRLNVNGVTSVRRTMAEENNDTEIKDRERIAKEIAKTSESIRKKYRALKTGKMEEDIALERHFRPVIEPLKQIAENSVGVKSDAPPTDSVELGNTPSEEKKHTSSGVKRKRSDACWNDSLVASTPIQAKRRRADLPITNSTPMYDYSAPTKILTCGSSTNTTLTPKIDDIFETSDDSFETSVRRELQTSEGQETLRSHFGPLGREYVGAVLRDKDKQNRAFDYCCGVNFTKQGLMLGDKLFDVDIEDNIIVNGIRYHGTPGLYELIFKRMPDDEMYTEEDKKRYKHILLATNAHRRGHHPLGQILSNRGHKYKYVIAPLMFDGERKKSGKGLNTPQAMMLNNRDIDYVYWDDPNELVDRLRLLDASRQAGNNAHDNEILSIIEELREAGLIIN